MMDELKRLKELTEVLTGNGYLRDQAAEWEYALDAIPEFVYIIDTKHNLKFVNKALAARLNSTKSELYNQKCYTAIKGLNYLNEAECELDEDCCDLRDSKEVRGEEQLPKLGGWFVYDRSAIYTKTNKLIGFICILRDITERKQLADETDKRQKILDTVFNTAPVGLGLLKKGVREFITVNKVLCEKLEYKLEELVGQSARIVYPSEEEYQRVGDIKHKEIEKNGIASIETQFKSKSGKLFDIALTTSITGNEGELAFTAVDITNRKKREKILSLNEDRIEALLTLSLMDNASEDELIDFVLEQAVVLTESKIGYIHFVEDNGPGQINLNLFKWSKDVHGFCDAKKVPHYPLENAGMWADCIRTMSPVVHNDYIGIKDKKGLPEGHFPIYRHMSIPVLDEGKVIAVLGVGNKELPYDASDIKQLTLFLNSMWDIIKRKRFEENFTDLINATPVGIHTYRLIDDELILWHFNPAAEKILNINGSKLIGKKIEEAFPTHKTTDIPEIYKKIARSGGVWQIEQLYYKDSALGIDSTFFVYAYQIKQNAMAAIFIDIGNKIAVEKELQRSKDLQREGIKTELKNFINKVDISKKILIVEDQEAISDLIAYHVAKMGFDVVVANTGQDAIKLIDENGICLVIVDLFLTPEVTGFDIIKKVASQHPDTPIIVVSGTTNASDIDDAMRCGAWDFIAKSAMLDALKESIENNLEQSVLIKKSKLLDKFLELTN